MFLVIPAQPTGKGGTSGGLALCFRKHLNLRRVHHFVRGGAGFQVAALRLKDADCYLVNVYLKSGEGFQGGHNAPILATLIAFLRSVQGLYFVAGDFNEDFEVMAATSLEQEAKGRWISSGESTCAGGGNIDFGLLAPVLAAGAHVSLDWITPFSPMRPCTGRCNFSILMCGCPSWFLLSQLRCRPSLFACILSSVHKVSRMPCFGLKVLCTSLGWKWCSQV